MEEPPQPQMPTPEQVATLFNGMEQMAGQIQALQQQLQQQQMHWQMQQVAAATASAPLVEVATATPVVAAAADGAQPARDAGGHLPNPPKPDKLSVANRLRDWLPSMDAYLRALSDPTIVASSRAADVVAPFLEGVFLSWLDQARRAAGGVNPWGNWAALRKALEDNFLPEDSITFALRQLQHLRQTGPVSQYTQSFNRCAQHLPVESSHTLLFRYIEGLKPMVQTQVQLQQIAGQINTLADAQRAAYAVDTIIYRASRPSPVFPPNRGRGGGGLSNSTAEPMELGVAQGSRDVVCWHCNKPGHVKSKCPVLYGNKDHEGKNKFKPKPPLKPRRPN